MICDECFKKYEDEIVGQVDNAGNEAIRLHRTKVGHLAFSNNFIPLYITSKKQIMRGKRKGEYKESENIHLFKTKYCSMCGKETKDK